ncbi:hypothetical protein M569_00665, partial [Genlisea aurea]
SRKQLAISFCGVITGIVCTAVGAHFSFANVAPQQARHQARREFLKARLRKIIDD